MLGDHVLRYIIELVPADQASQHEKMHLIYENTEYCELRRGVIARRWTCEYYGGYGFVLKNPSTYLHWIHNEVLDQSIHWHREEENIWISYVMNDYKDQSERIRECENQKNIRFAVRLEAMGVFGSIELVYPKIGHTQESCDGIFRCLDATFWTELADDMHDWGSEEGARLATLPANRRPPKAKAKAQPTLHLSVDGVDQAKFRVPMIVSSSNDCVIHEGGLWV